MMQIDGSAILKRASGRIFWFKSMRFFEKNNQNRTRSAAKVSQERCRRIGNSDHIATLDPDGTVADPDIRAADGSAHSRLCVLTLATMILDRADACVSSI